MTCFFALSVGLEGARVGRHRWSAGVDADLRCYLAVDGEAVYRHLRILPDENRESADCEITQVWRGEVGDLLLGDSDVKLDPHLAEQEIRPGAGCQHKFFAYKCSPDR